MNNDQAVNSGQLTVNSNTGDQTQVGVISDANPVSNLQSPVSIPTTDPTGLTDVTDVTTQPTSQPGNQATNQPSIDDIVAQGSAIQDLFAQNDVGVVNSEQLTVNSFGVSDQTVPTSSSTDLTGLTGFQPQADEPLAQTDLTNATNQPGNQSTSQPSNQPATDQRSPLDILEEILAKEEKKAEPAIPDGPTPEEIEKAKQEAAAEVILLEEQRRKMMTEVQTDEQKNRDQIRHQQTDALKVVNPYEIKQLERKKFSGQ